MIQTLLTACVSEKKPDDFVFTRKDGSQVRDIRSTWESACISAGG